MGKRKAAQAEEAESPVFGGQTTAVANWDEEMANLAKVSLEQEQSVSTGNSFSLKGGILSYDGAPVKDNKMGVIILDSVLANVYYEGEFDPESPQGPTCFAFGRNDKDMRPHEVVFAAGQNQCPSDAGCVKCPKNEFGSALKGRGKACKNSRRLVVIPGGTFEGDKFIPFTSAKQLVSPLANFHVPVTSVRDYSTYSKQILAIRNRPLFFFVTKIQVKPDPDTQIKVVFEALHELPDALRKAAYQRHQEAKAVIEAPYALSDGSEKPVAKAAGKKKRKY